MKLLRVSTALAVCAATLSLTACKMHDPADEIPRAICGPGSEPETGFQGQIPLADRNSGRSQKSYSCNMKLVSQYQGTGNATKGARYNHCMYASSFYLGNRNNPKPGVQVADFSDLENPRLSTILDSRAARSGTWESMSVHKERGLLAMTSVPLIVGGGFISLYDVASDCTQPRLLNGIFGTNLTAPHLFLSHEGNFSPDGKTYWTSSQTPGQITAFDVSNPSFPRIIFQGLTGLTNHGFSFNEDGTRMYIASMIPSGITIFDVSDIQKRHWFPRIRRLGGYTWQDGLVTQYAIPFTQNDQRYLFAMDELGNGGVRLLDINDEKNPRQIRKYELEINRIELTELRKQDTTGNGIWGYEAHYCTIDKPVDPQWLVCNYVNSGVRLFDISDALKPKEVAYFIPPGRAADRDKLVNSAHAITPIGTPFSDIFNHNIGTAGIELGKPNMTTDWCMSQPEFVGNQIWVHCDDNGALVIELTNGVGPQ